jgi:hypothetical protein
MVLVHDENLLAKQVQKLSRPHLRRRLQYGFITQGESTSKTNAKTFKIPFNISIAQWFYYMMKVD